MSGVDLVPLVDEGLGNSAYLVDLGDGRALVVDVSRDLRAVHEAAAKRGLTVAFAADTHLHADFLSGAYQLAATSGARCWHRRLGIASSLIPGCTTATRSISAGCGCAPCSTPGHTHEHLAFLLLDGDREVGVFTGGSLIVGSAARTDLVSDDRTEELTRAQYASLRRLATLPGDVQVWPTHGAGSFCSAPPGAERTSTIARELATNPLLRAARRKRLRRTASRLAGQLSALLPPTRRDQSHRPTAAGRRSDAAAAERGRGAGTGGRRRGPHRYPLRRPLRAMPCLRRDLDPVAAGVRELAGLARAR